MKKLMVVVFALAAISAMGCNRNKQAAVAPAPQVAPYSQPAVNAAAPAPVTRRSSAYVK